MQFHVSAEHIERGSRNSLTRNAVALAINEHPEMSGLLVSCSWDRLWLVGSALPPTPLPPDVVSWSEEFDAGLVRGPLTFEIPDEVLRPAIESARRERKAR